jgi:nucleoside-diphosphate-sugar epimerase
MSSTPHRLISVIGATGNQGGGVVELLLETTDYNVRAISSNPSSDKAKALLERHSKFVDAKRFEVVEGNLNDRASLEEAIKGSNGVFASFSPTPSDGPIEENPEVLQGKNLVDALKVSNLFIRTRPAFSPDIFLFPRLSGSSTSSTALFRASLNSLRVA